jgi:hypothetical protein
MGRQDCLYRRDALYANLQKTLSLYRSLEVSSIVLIWAVPWLNKASSINGEENKSMSQQGGHTVFILRLYVAHTGVCYHAQREL